MPLISIDAIAPQCHLGLWRIEDPIDDIIATDNRLAGVVDKIEHFHSESRRKEVLAVYGLLFAMTDNTCLRIEHDDLSRPVIDGYHVSISHTRGYAALLLSTRHKVAIDIEFISNRVERVASKFIRNDEVADSLYAKLIHWSAKETIYKLFANENLDFFDMRIAPFDQREEGDIEVDDLKIEKKQSVHYLCNDKYVLTYAAV